MVKTEYTVSEWEVKTVLQCIEYSEYNEYNRNTRLTARRATPFVFSLVCFLSGFFGPRRAQLPV